MTWDSGRSADIRHSDQEGLDWETLKTARKFETPEEKAIRLGYLPHEKALRRLGLPPCMRSE